MAGEPAGRVVLIASPIGNLGDITYRAVECLRSCDAIACEDTRHSRRLLQAYDIPPKPLISLNDRNEAARSEEIAGRILSRNECVAVLSDAGMPTISDPGYRLVQLCISREIPVEVLPGPSAVLTALAGSGLPTDAHFFGGFLPHKSGKRERILRQALERECTSIFFESPYRIGKTIATLAQLDPGRPICLARELTKKFETFHRGTARDLAEDLAEKPLKGEMTLLISGLTRQRKKQRRDDAGGTFPEN